MNMQIDKLNRSNYSTWKFNMKMFKALSVIFNYKRSEHVSLKNEYL